MMNYLISAYSVNPYHGSEDGVGWNWVLQYEKNYKAGIESFFLQKNIMKKILERDLKNLELNTLN